MRTQVAVADFLAVVDGLREQGYADMEIARAAGLSDGTINRARCGYVKVVNARTHRNVVEVAERCASGELVLHRRGVAIGALLCTCSNPGCIEGRVAAAERAKAKARRRKPKPRPVYCDDMTARALLTVLIERGWTLDELAAAGVDRVALDRLTGKGRAWVTQDVVRRMELLLSVKRAPSSPWADRRAS